MYSFAPLPDPTDSHFGFYFTLFVCVCISLWALFDFFFEDRYSRLPGVGLVLVLAVTGMITAFAYKVSYAENQTPKNEVVTGKLIGFQSEGYNERSGKSRADRHYTYVIYEVPEGQVMLPSCAGCVYPPYATLYKN